MTILPSNSTIQTLVLRLRYPGDRPFRYLNLGRISLVLALLGAMTSSAQAGFFQPFLKLSQPTVEGRIRQECENLADQHLGNVLKAQWQPLCQVGAKKISSCLLEQANHQGKEWALLQEGISGTPGEVTQSLLLACAGQLLGLQATPSAADQGSPAKPTESPAL